MGYTLYYMPATASMCVHWMLIELGVPFETVLVDFEAGAQKTPVTCASIPPAGCRRW
jgi:glutathione S-transferase